ncbi:MAG: hypothetical protein EPN33_03365 [Acidobacteria bacterium]|nr:MAG: hypothetical protein EPN33_03365 [Acidobacteriota bacterium]
MKKHYLSPAALVVASPQIAASTYPRSSTTRRLIYRKTVSLPALEKAMATHFHGSQLDLAHRVVYIHGVPPSTKLPATVVSLPGVPAQATLPVACGQLAPGQ